MKSISILSTFLASAATFAQAQTQPIITFTVYTDLNCTGNATTITAVGGGWGNFSPAQKSVIVSVNQEPYGLDLYLSPNEEDLINTAGFDIGVCFDTTAGPWESYGFHFDGA